MELDLAIGSFLAHRRAKGNSDESTALYRRQLDGWQRWRRIQRPPLPTAIEAIGIDELRSYIAYLVNDHVPHGGNSHRAAAERRGLAPASVHTAARIIRALWKFAEGEGWLTIEQTRFWGNGRIALPKIPEQRRPAADSDLVGKLLGAVATAPVDAETRARDRAIVRLLFESGLRVGELCKLRDRDVQLQDRSAAVVGKGGKFRHIFWGDETAAALAAYLRLRRGSVGGDVPFFRGTSDRNDGEQLTRDAVRAQLKRHAKRGGFALPFSAPVHSFRHGFVHTALDAGLDLSEVAQLAGHRNIATTMFYARRAKERLRQAHARVFRPSGVRSRARESYDEG